MICFGEVKGLQGLSEYATWSILYMIRTIVWR
ncbi:hypothetical protein ARTHRO_30384 [Limnospira indica PCC 8005]|uniref:Uncharacterized protein n=1 Tax=Limnospira indica PCC 8005 TaxID=376219 RepID=A0A9P1KFH6_9CYAN|nr:hypothetical protein ARTHRO_30384 [Limnospira indica PCC 8005]